jgi:hypothetical protein
LKVGRIVWKIDRQEEHRLMHNSLFSYASFLSPYFWHHTLNKGYIKQISKKKKKNFIGF